VPFRCADGPKEGVVNVISSQYVGGIVWEFVMLADLPISLVAYFLARKNGLFSMIWIFVAGTLWWYFLSQRFLKRRAQ
jgi:hypothetical protein